MDDLPLEVDLVSKISRGDGRISALSDQKLRRVDERGSYRRILYASATTRNHLSDWQRRELGVRRVQRFRRELVGGKFLHGAQGHGFRHADPLITADAGEVFVEHGLGCRIGEQ